MFEVKHLVKTWFWWSWFDSYHGLEESQKDTPIFAKLELHSLLI